jgi:hypothetical protein
MKNFLVSFAVAGLLMLSTSAAFAQRYVSPTFNGCVHQFYDSQMYNWLAFENNCSESLNVTFVPYIAGHGGGGAMELRPGRHDSTGLSRREVGDNGGFELYVCPAGYIPVGPDDRYVTRVIPQFRCKRQ